MKFKAYYKEHDHQGFWNEKEMELPQDITKDKVIKSDGSYYNIKNIVIEESSNQQGYSIYLSKHCYSGASGTLDASPVYWRAKHIVICGSVQNYDVNEFIAAAESITDKFETDKHIGTLTIINGYLPLDVVQEKQLDPTWANYLNNYNQVSFYDSVNNKVRREEMAEFASKVKAQVFVLGEIKDGVKEEFDLLQNKGLMITCMPL